MISHHEINSMDNPKRILCTPFSLVILALFSLAPLEAQAQEEPGTTYIGVSGGLAQSTFSGDGTSASSRQGFIGGAFAGYNFTSFFSVELQVLYAERGADDVSASGEGNMSGALAYDGDRITLEYIEVPLLFKFTAPIENVKIRGFVGPSFDNVSSATINGQENLGQLQSNLKLEERLLFYDIGGIVGGEIAFPLPAIVDEVALDGRYHFGFKNLDQFEGFNMENRSFRGTLSLRFDL